MAGSRVEEWKRSSEGSSREKKGGFLGSSKGFGQATEGFHLRDFFTSAFPRGSRRNEQGDPHRPDKAPASG